MSSTVIVATIIYIILPPYVAASSTDSQYPSMRLCRENELAFDYELAQPTRTLHLFDALSGRTFMSIFELEARATL